MKTRHSGGVLFHFMIISYQLLTKSEPGFKNPALFSMKFSHDKLFSGDALFRSYSKMSSGRSLYSRFLLYVNFIKAWFMLLGCLDERSHNYWSLRTPFFLPEVEGGLIIGKSGSAWEVKNSPPPYYWVTFLFVSNMPLFIGLVHRVEAFCCHAMKEVSFVYVCFGAVLCRFLFVSTNSFSCLLQNHMSEVNDYDLVSIDQIHSIATTF